MSDDLRLPDSNTNNNLHSEITVLCRENNVQLISSICKCKLKDVINVQHSCSLINVRYEYINMWFFQTIPNRDVSMLLSDIFCLAILGQEYKSMLIELERNNDLDGVYEILKDYISWYKWKR